MVPHANAHHMQSFVLSLAAFALLASGLSGQLVNAPVIFPRGVTDHLRHDPAPATVARGAVIEINGFNLGPDTSLTFKAAPLPTSLGSPTVQVLINGTAAGLYSVSGSQILARVPTDAPLGLANIQVVVGSATSAPRVFTVAAALPGVETRDLGFGQVALAAGAANVLVTTGLGVNPRPAVTAYVGGIRAAAQAQASATNPGFFGLTLEVPGAARPGDVVYLNTAGRTANLATWQRASAPEVAFVKLPEGTPALVQISTTDVNGKFVLGLGARDAQGCFRTFTFDMANLESAALNSCLIANAAAATPFVAVTGTEYVAALVGPATGQAPAGISKQVLIAAPGKETRTVALSGAAATLAAVANNPGAFTAVIPGVDGGATTIDTITAETGAVRNAAAPANVGVAAVLISVDGLTRTLTNRINLPDNQFAIVVADSLTNPQRVVFAILKANGEKVSATPLPGGWVPLLGPAAPAVNNPNPGAGAALGAAPGLAFYIAETKRVYLAAKRADDTAHAFVAFPLDASGPAVVAMPDGWFLAACTTNIRTYNFVMGRKLALFGSNSGTNTFLASCPSTGFILVDLLSGALTTASLPPNSDMVIGAAAGSFNDFLYATNLNGAGASRMASSIFVLDGADFSTLRLDVPAGLAGFQAPTTIPLMDSLVATAQKRAVGDSGFVFFDLAQGAVRQFALPAGFTTATLAGFFPASRKLVARAVAADRRTSFIVYDIATGAATPVPNPDGVASLAARPGAAVSPRLLVANPNTNTISAAGFDIDGNQVGVVTVRIP